MATAKVKLVGRPGVTFTFRGEEIPLSSTNTSAGATITRDRLLLVLRKLEPSKDFRVDPAMLLAKELHTGELMDQATFEAKLQALVDATPAKVPRAKTAKVAAAAPNAGPAKVGYMNFQDKYLSKEGIKVYSDIIKQFHTKYVAGELNLNTAVKSAQNAAIAKMLEVEGAKKKPAGPAKVNVAALEAVLKAEYKPTAAQQERFNDCVKQAMETCKSKYLVAPVTRKLTNATRKFNSVNAAFEKFKANMVEFLPAGKTNDDLKRSKLFRNSYLSKASLGIEAANIWVADYKKTKAAEAAKKAATARLLANVAAAKAAAGESRKRRGGSRRTRKTRRNRNRK